MANKCADANLKNEDMRETVKARREVELFQNAIKIFEHRKEGFESRGF